MEANQYASKSDTHGSHFFLESDHRFASIGKLYILNIRINRELSEVIESHVMKVMQIIQVMQVIQMRHGMKAMLEMQGSQVIQVSLAHLAKCGALHLI